MDMADTDEVMFFNGIRSDTGNYFMPSLKVEEVLQFAKGGVIDAKLLAFLEIMHQRVSQEVFGLPMNTDPADLKQAGWCVVFHQDEDPLVKAALQPLIEHRRAEIGNDQRCKILDFKDKEPVGMWLARHGTDRGSVTPEKVPFYVLLVGGPEKIPFRFGYELDVEYAVGRIHFDTTPEYAQYIKSLIAHETGTASKPAKEAVFFGTRHSFDGATQLSADHLVKPLHANTVLPDGFTSRLLLEREANKDALKGLLAAGNRPSVLFTASHGLVCPADDMKKQQQTQGALVCQDWPGFGQIKPEHYFAASDLPDDANLEGMVMFQFACFGAGTPKLDQFFNDPTRPLPILAEQPFVSTLPKKLLSHPNGAALAYIGHIERAWGYSIVNVNGTEQLQPFSNTLGMLLQGRRIGYALKDFNERYAALSVDVANKIRDERQGEPVVARELVTTWAQRNDAEGYIVIGDPAIHL
jgi:hypothetical protein